MITLLAYWISCKYDKDMDLLYFGTIAIDLAIVDIVKNLLK